MLYRQDLPGLEIFFRFFLGKPLKFFRHFPITRQI